MFFTKTTIPERITTKIIAAIKRGQVPPWRRPTSDFENDGFPTHPATLKPFAGVDVLLTNMAATEKGHRSKFWASEDEWRYLACKVSGRPTILADGTAVFNADQTNSVTHRSRKRRTLVAVDYGPAEAVITSSGADIRHIRGTEAAYYYRHDYIVLPERWQFIEGPGGLEAYYDSLLHELAHWTEPRLEWSRLEFSVDPVVNELRAEIAAPFMTAQLGLPVFADMKILANHRNHLDRWVKAMKDPTLIFHVADAASDAAEYLLSLTKAAAY